MSRECLAAHAAIMGLLIRQGIGDLTDAFESAKALRDGSTAGTDDKADYRFVADRLEAALAELDRVVDRLDLRNGA